jgi:hypothetical protein
MICIINFDGMREGIESSFFYRIDLVTISNGTPFLPDSSL